MGWCNGDPSRTDPINIEVALCINWRLTQQLGPHRSEYVVEKISLDVTSRNEPNDTVWKARLEIENCDITYVRGDGHYKRSGRKQPTSREPTFI